MPSALQRLATELGDLTPEELAVVLPEAARRVSRAPHWRGGRRDLAYRLRKAAECTEGIAARRREREVAVDAGLITPEDRLTPFGRRLVERGGRADG